jgi:LPS transport system D
MADAQGLSKLQIGLVTLISLAAGSAQSIATLSNESGMVSRESLQPEIGDEALQTANNFDNIDFPIQAIAGDISMNARGGWVWKEGQTHRVVLHHDVDVVLAQHRFIAESANMWIRKLSENTASGTTRYQIYAIFEKLRSADGTITMNAEQLPVRGVIEVDSPISMNLVARFDEPPRSKTLTADFVERTNELYAQRVLGAPMPEMEPEPNRPWLYAQDNQTQQNTVLPIESESAPQVVQEGEMPDQVAKSEGPIFEPSGIFSTSIGGRVVIDGASSGTGSIITADGGVVIQYMDPSSRQWIDFKSERVVIYTRGSEAVNEVSRLATGQIEGIYLEGGVFAGDDQWSVRSPRMYIDVVNNKALMLDAVFWATDQKTAMPLYVRAESVRQTAADEFRADKAKISNTAFFEPDLTIGISDIKVNVVKNQEQNEESEGGFADSDLGSTVLVDGKNVTLNAGSIPVLWLPGFKGDPSSFPLREIKVEDSNRSGTAFKTRWNAISLLKIDAPPGVDADLDLDFYGDRGLGIGVESDWRTEQHRGGLFSYLLINDNGTDVTPSGQRLTRDGENRGIFAFYDIWEFTNNWTLVTELSYISDEAFVPALFEDLGRETEDFRNRLQLERRGERSYFALEISSTVNDFIVPEHLLQSPGYQVSRLPEARFVSLSRDLLPEYQPGLLTYSFEARAGLLKLSFSEVDAKSYGFTTDSLADDAFGTTASESLGDKFRAMGLDESTVGRLDTRHELTARFDLGPIRVLPFAVGRVTAYDTSFSSFSPEQGDEVRYWGGGGVTLATTIQKVNNNIDNRFFDIHRLRHIVEPSITIWGSDSNFDQTDLPIYDDEVEGVVEGTMIRAAVDQTWQTKRGGVGRWRDVDVLKLRSEYVWSSEEAGKSEIPDYFSSRPELSNPGEYIGTSAVWQPTEVLAVAGEMVYDLDRSRTARASIGTIIDHSPSFRTSLEYREVRPINARFASLAARYRLTDKYSLNTSLNYNFDVGDFQTFYAQVLRRFQIGSLGATVRYDNIRGETSIGFVFRPSGSSGDLSAEPSWGG